MTRIVAGSARGRRLAVPPGGGTRPTADRAREALFSTVDSLTTLAGARFLDLFAGSGAVGLEAVSRGAAHALLVEADRRAARVAAANVDALGLPAAQVRSERAERLLAVPPAEAPYDVLFADPPYDLADDDLRALLDAALDNGWLRAGALVVVERASRGGQWAWPARVHGDRSRRYGEATLWYGRAAM